MSFAAGLLRRFSYSSRPQWDDFGHLSSCGRGQRYAPLFLPDRFGTEIWKRLEGRTVLDYGCGYGADVIACCMHGIDAVGIEQRQFMVEGAQERASEAGLSRRFYNVDNCASLEGSFDCILSINSFEHYLDPADVLQHMSRFLKPNGGTVLVYFSPPWLHPYGAHCREITPLPWVQFFFPESAIMAIRSEYLNEKPTCYENAAGGLGRMTVAKFERVVAQSPFFFRELELVGIRNLNLATKIPGVRELMTSAIRAELESKRQRKQ
jgi:SAM-dependent methyltransferase